MPSEAWIHWEPGQQSFVLPWTLATLKDGRHVIGQQDSVTDEFTKQVAVATFTYIDSSETADFVLLTGLDRPDFTLDSYISPL